MENTVELRSQKEIFLTLPLEERQKRLAQITDIEAEQLLYDWNFVGRPKQIAPQGDWRIWLIMAGRGFGKTRTGAEWVRDQVKKGRKRIAIITPTSADARDVAVEGESGILSISPSWDKPNYEPSKRRLTWSNGAIATLYSAEEPERLRGPQHDAAWMDEIAAWAYLQETWDMAQFGLRLGTNPQTVITSTPKPSSLLFQLVKEEKDPEKRIVITVGNTYENKSNLAKPFLDQILQYEGTTLGRQEIHAELIDMSEAGIIKKSQFKWWSPKNPTPEFVYIIQSYDTAFTEKTHNDPTACTVWGVFRPTRESPFCVLLLDAWQEHLKYPDLRDRVQDEYISSVYGSNDQRADIVLIEDKGSGITLRQDLQRAGVPVKAYNPGNADKVTRVHSISHLVANSRVYLPSNKTVETDIATWGRDFLEQLTMFPTPNQHDDYVDTFSQALALLRDSSWLTIQQDDDLDKEYNTIPEARVRDNPYSI
jgi:predicted phage terminase large subunit-like protein